jgi:isoleucyl-tRNA synthetase
MHFFTIWVDIMTKQKQTNKKYDFKEIENNVMKFWKKHDKEIIKKSISHDPKKELFSWLEGPPTANAPPGLHHVEVRVFKDLVCRFKYMQGYSVPRKGGWDCHGLPVEVQVEKKLGLKTKKDVVKYGEKKFIEECKSDVFTFVKDWTRVTEKLAFWVDLEKPYMTLNTNFMESVWWSLKELFYKDLLYKGHKVVPYCPRCETPLSSHEVALGYKDVIEDSVTVKFKLHDDDRYILAWTTTPWTLISNLALAVNSDLMYATVEVDGEKYILAKDLVSKYFPEAKILEEFKGATLEGKSYEPLYDYVQDELDEQKDKKHHIVITADYVSVEDGTGIVHQAPAFGEDDYNECKKNNIAFVNPVDKSGKYMSKVKKFKNRFVKDCDQDIIQDLDDRKLLIKAEPYEHAYPFCWRCKTPLLYYAMESWFVSVSKYAQRMVELNQDISWYPSHIQEGRFGNWISGAKDWAVSRNKFWGTPLPIWICDDCGHQVAIGSIDELKELTGTKVDDLHKPTVDGLTFECPQDKCKGTMKRTPEVIDCWYDSGSAPFAQYHYPFENKEIFDKSYPYSFISEAIDQTRGWFYTMHVLGTLLFDKQAYNSCAVGGLLCDENGEKMSKSKGNIVKPDEIFDQVGVDAVRMLMCSYPLGEQIKFGMKPMDESVKPFFNTLWNSYFFVKSYLDLFNLKGEEVAKAQLAVEDEWMLSRVNELVKEITFNLEHNEYNHAVNKIQSFVIDDFSRWYIKLIRDRTNEQDKALAYVFKYIIERVVKLMAPITPYVSETIFQDFIKNKDTEISVHNESWPKVEKINTELNKNMDLARDFVQGILAVRDKAQIGVRWPLGTINVLFEDLNDKSIADRAQKALKMLKPLIFAHTNIKNIEIVEKFKHLDYSMKPNYRSMGEDFGTDTGDVLNHVKTLDQNAIMNSVVQGYDYVIHLEDGREFSLYKKHFDISKTVHEPWAHAEFKYGEIFVSKELTPELMNEGFAREITRRIQALRKDSGLEKQDKIELYVKPASDINLQLEEFIEQIQTKVGAEKIEISTATPSKDYKFSSTDKIKGNEFTVMLNKL